MNNISRWIGCYARSLTVCTLKPCIGCCFKGCRFEISEAERICWIHKTTCFSYCKAAIALRICIFVFLVNVFVSVPKADENAHEM